MYNNKQVKAGGILFYRRNKKKKRLELLMIKSQDKYGDFGGKVETKDKSFKETAIRETYEESNGIFSKKFMKKKLRGATKLYNEKSKYLTYLCELDNVKFSCKDFGNKETYENIDRTVKWITYERYRQTAKQNKLHFRLRFKKLYQNLANLNRSCETIIS